MRRVDGVFEELYGAIVAGQRLSRLLFCLFRVAALIHVARWWCREIKESVGLLDPRRHYTYIHTYIHGHRSRNKEPD